MKEERDSLDKQLDRLSPEDQMVLLVYGEAGPGDEQEQLARQARALRGIAKALMAAGISLSESEGYQAF